MMTMLVIIDTADDRGKGVKVTRWSSPTPGHSPMQICVSRTVQYITFTTRRGRKIFSCSRCAFTLWQEEDKQCGAEPFTTEVQCNTVLSKVVLYSVLKQGLGREDGSSRTVQAVQGYLSAQRVRVVVKMRGGCINCI